MWGSTVPDEDGSAIAGSTYDSRDDLEPDAKDEQFNLARWLELTGEATAAIEVLSNHVGIRHTTRDHMPMIGPIADEAALFSDPGAWVRNDRLAIPTLPGILPAGAFGSRGLLFASLAAQLIADQIDGSPQPLEASLAAQSAPIPPDAANDAQATRRICRTRCKTSVCCTQRDSTALSM